MKKTYFLILFSIVFKVNAQNTFPPGDVEINNAKLTIETASWRPSLLTLKDTHYSPNQVYNFQIESDGLKIKQDGNTNYQFKSGGNLIVNNGNVMLGAGNPLFKLHIKDPSGGAALGLERGGKLWRFDIQDNADRLYIGHTDNTSLITFHKNGNVGIGTTNPQNPIEIVTNKSTHALFKGSFAGIQGIQVEREGGDNIRLVTNYLGAGGGLESSSTLRFSVNGNKISTPAVVINASGSMSIGTTGTGSHQLAVGGSIGAREIKVEAGTWSDFVFYTNYNLPTLKEVENHIKEKGHLQDIPSAKEVEENGINLGEMNAKLLQKIEELMLYTIHQQKEIIEMKKEIEKFKKTH